ncbi:helix-turn-helix domain-containing protein [Roseateles chitinivorans]|uniref:helix-turn-helix domain-containing protein n=1 Tax=Roseateles chitinivorans TaxID=2917965 RepID=UPI003D674BE0
MRLPLPKAPHLVVKAARLKLGLTQEAFATQIKTSQSLVSKYESGQVAPPAEILMHCVHVLSSPGEDSVSENALLDLVRERLSGKHRAAIRAAVADLILGLVPAASPKRRSRKPKASA